jgi:hypothetical protein
LTEQKSQGKTSPTIYHAEVNPSQIEDHPTNQHINKHQYQQVKSGHKSKQAQGSVFTRNHRKRSGQYPASLVLVGTSVPGPHLRATRGYRGSTLGEPENKSGKLNLTNQFTHEPTINNRSENNYQHQSQPH